MDHRWMPRDIPREVYISEFDDVDHELATSNHETMKLNEMTSQLSLGLASLPLHQIVMNALIRSVNWTNVKAKITSIIEQGWDQVFGIFLKFFYCFLPFAFFLEPAARRP